KIGLLGVDLRQGVLAIMGKDDVEAVTAKPARHHVPKFLVVLNKQDFGHAARPLRLTVLRSI
ncbi:MAG: hypothetical protein QOH17_5064, partial [Pseudonocardiales bacterium]|nr:hypothetical protein [Pseudonocardiales bacterium]